MALHQKFVIPLIMLSTVGLLLAPYSHADLPLTIESLTTDKGRFKLDTTVSYFNQNSSNLLSQGSTNIDLGDGRSITIPNIPTEGKVNTDNLIGTLGLRYGITEDWEVGVKANALTLEQRLEHDGKVTTQSDDRFQDILLTTQYQLTKNHNSLPDSLVFTELSIYDNTQGLKSDYLTSALVGSTIYTVNDPIALSLTGTYQYNGNRDFKESIGKVDIGDVFSLNGSVGFAVNPDITLNTGIGWRMVKGDKFDNSDISSAKYTETSLNVGLAYALNERSNLTANLRTPVSGDSGSTLSLGMTTKLGKLPPPISEQYRKHKQQTQ